MIADPAPTRVLPELRRDRRRHRRPLPARRSETAPGLYYAGDMAEGPGTVVSAVASGKNAAQRALDRLARKRTAKQTAGKSRIILPGRNLRPVPLDSRFLRPDDPLPLPPLGLAGHRRRRADARGLPGRLGRRRPEDGLRRRADPHPGRVHVRPRPRHLRQLRQRLGTRPGPRLPRNRDAEPRVPRPADRGLDRRPGHGRRRVRPRGLAGQHAQARGGREPWPSNTASPAPRAGTARAATSSPRTPS